MRVLVTGGSGQVGGLVVAELRRRGHDAVPASRRTGVDLTTGEGLSRVLVGAEAVVHCADTTSPRRWGAVTVGATARLARVVAEQQVPPHLVTISIVGCDRSAFAYYRAKADADAAVLASGAPATVVRATQFHTLAAQVAGGVTLGPVAIGLRGMAVQPCEVAWVASRLVDVATGPAPDSPTVIELAGPEVLTLGEVTTALADHRGRREPRLLALPAVGRTMRSFAHRDNLPRGEVETGGSRFAEWLATQPT